jgi:hypothetical protein
MKKLFACSIVLLLLAGCGAKTETKVDPITGQTVTIEESSFWDSGNSKMFYEMEMTRATEARASAEAKIAAIGAQAKAMQAAAQTPTEALLTGVIATLSINAVPTDVRPSGIAPPKTVADVMDKSLVPLLGLGLQAYQVFGGEWGESHRTSRDQSPDMTITGTGNSIIYQSDYARTLSDDYNLSSMHGSVSASGSGFGGYDGSNHYSETTGNQEASYGLDL